jgi:hypothetical protein
MRPFFFAATLSHRAKILTVNVWLTLASVDSSCVNAGKLMNPPDTDLLLTLAGPGDVVGGLHPHERVHFHSALRPTERLKSGQPVTLKKLGAETGAAGQELQLFRSRMALVADDQR